ncbi:unnamed protein product [Lupinus luteus]|uniref:Uncharacterized protein n=1 Tax=Lupinus luteus TaxID=3873 RepID=A0AAV1XPE1_LUPLU
MPGSSSYECPMWTLRLAGKYLRKATLVCKRVLKVQVFYYITGERGSMWYEGQPDRYTVALSLVCGPNLLLSYVWVSTIIETSSKGLQFLVRITWIANPRRHPSGSAQNDKEALPRIAKHWRAPPAEARTSPGSY